MNTDKELKWLDWIGDNESALGFTQEDFGNAKDKTEFLNAHRDKIRNIKGAPTWTKSDLKKAAQSLLEDYKSFDEIPVAYFETIAEENKVSPSELKEAFETAQSKKRIETKLDTEEEGRERRRKELDEMPFYKSMLMSESSKKRYIEDPNASMFGKEGKFNPYSSEGQKELRDVILGGAGAFADAIPGLGGVVLGPAARGIRTAVNADDKSVIDVGKEIASDLGTNLGINYTPTFALNIAKKYAKGVSKDIPSLANAIWEGGVKGTYDRMKKDLKDVGDLASKALKRKEKDALPENIKWVENIGWKPSKQAKIESKFADDIAESQFANDIKKYAEKHDIPLTEAAKRYTDTLNKGEYKNMFDADIDPVTGKKYLTEHEDSYEAIKRELGEGAEELVRKEGVLRSLTPGGKVVDAVTHLFNVAGEPAVKITKDLAADSATPKDNGEQEKRLARLGLSRKSKEGDFEKSLNKIINDNERQWEAGFKPNAIPGDPIYEAWLKWNRGK